MLTLGTLVAVFFAARALPGFFGEAVVVTGLLAAGFVSLLNRVILQGLTGGTVGKLLTGLCVIDAKTGRRPGMASLSGQWIVGVFLLVVALGNGNDGMSDNPFPSVVRREDARRLGNSLPPS